MPAAEPLGPQRGAQLGAAGSGSPVPCACSLRGCRRTKVVKVTITLVAEEKRS